MLIVSEEMEWNGIAGSFLLITRLFSKQCVHICIAYCCRFNTNRDLGDYQ